MSKFKIRIGPACLAELDNTCAGLRDDVETGNDSHGKTDLQGAKELLECIDRGGRTHEMSKAAAGVLVTYAEFGGERLSAEEPRLADALYNLAGKVSDLI